MTVYVCCTCTRYMYVHSRIRMYMCLQACMYMLMRIHVLMHRCIWCTCMSMQSVCVQVCMHYIDMYVGTCVSIYMYAHTHTHTHTRTCVHAAYASAWYTHLLNVCVGGHGLIQEGGDPSLSIYTHTVHIHVWMYVCMHACMYVCMCIYIYI